MPSITVLDGENVPHGPFTREEISQKLLAGEINLDSLAYVDGVEAWTPLRVVLSHVSGSTRPVPTPDAMQTGEAPSRNLPYSGFWVRGVSFLLDGIIVFIPFAVIQLGIVAYGRIYPADPPIIDPNVAVPMPATSGFLDGFNFYASVGLGTFMVIATWLYFALQESSEAQATIGKRVMGLKVTDLRGDPISFPRATARYIGKLLSTGILGIGYVMAGFTDRRQGLHDMVARTLVLRD